MAERQNIARKPPLLSPLETATRLQPGVIQMLHTDVSIRGSVVCFGGARGRAFVLELAMVIKSRVSVFANFDTATSFKE